MSPPRNEVQDSAILHQPTEIENLQKETMNIHNFIGIIIVISTNLFKNAKDKRRERDSNPQSLPPESNALPLGHPAALVRTKRY